MQKTCLRIIVFIIVAAGVLSQNQVKAQELYPGSSFEGQVVYGAHAIGGAGGTLQDKLYGLDFSYQKDLSHLNDKWVGLTHAQSAGVGLIFRNLQYLKGHQDTSANSFGKAIGLVGQMDFKLFKKGGTSITLRPGIGLSYLSKTFFTDKRNRFISSHINEILKADLMVRVSVSPEVDLTAGAGFLHYSNGGYKVPNSGLNMLSLSTGLQFKTNPVKKEKYLTKFTQLRKNTFELNMGIGRRGVFEGHGGLLKSGVYGGYNVYINDVLSLKSGFEAVYYYTPFDPALGVKTFQYYGTSFDKWRTGLSVGAETTIWRLALNGQVGKYLYYNSYYENINWFWTTGLVYNLNPHVGIQAKTYFHGSQADFINYGLVFRI